MGQTSCPEELIKQIHFSNIVLLLVWNLALSLLNLGYVALRSKNAGLRLSQEFSPSSLSLSINFIFYSVVCPITVFGKDAGIQDASWARVKGCSPAPFSGHLHPDPVTTSAAEAHLENCGHSHFHVMTGHCHPTFMTRVSHRHMMGRSGCMAIWTFQTVVR